MLLRLRSILPSVSGSPTPSPTPAPVGGLVEARTRTTVGVSANAFDTRASSSGCSPNGCAAANTRDDSLSSRWSCKEALLGGKNCKITYSFEDAQDIVRMRVAFYKGVGRTRALKILTNGSRHSVVESSGESSEFEDFDLNTDETKMLTLEALGLRGSDWISLTEILDPSDRQSYKFTDCTRSRPGSMCFWIYLQTVIVYVTMPHLLGSYLGSKLL